ncbi:hypothetical protein KGQ20_14820 [Catenulispora sp. NF23]|uniref:Zinc-finger domain-containing protein n=1 Tax=Catenulispora pinistramenti TaxID=2705254 RepID=A0ABS5KXF1_9ACTN|nr:hypothetical protein [Catenulispora pinistramenti]MBS2534044.1 hypothetical protein [Catenulispora pinistramenti]MBS2550690.1 hypothetical protein [Catenulispora pinistramenti]
MITDPAASQPGTHLDPDQLADLFEGLLDPPATESARAHLASCPLCSTDFALIAGDTGLADLLPPVPIPQDVMIRVEAALDREPPLSTAPAADTVPAGHAAARPRRRRFRIALGSLAGATLVIVGGIGGIVALNSGSGEAKSNADSAAANGAVTRPDGVGSQSDKAPGPGMSPQVGVGPDHGSSSTTDSTLTIQQQAEDLIGGHMSAPANGTSQGSSPVCLPSSVPSGAQLLAHTQTQYQGKPASLSVYSQPGSTTVADVYVVDLDSCTSGKTGQAVTQTTIPRP